ncbi:MAG: hypothetical protein INR64_02475 [Caulobacteraceae bacterium]|nr:hypothetical protein [Caulobacter sp.]
MPPELLEPGDMLVPLGVEDDVPGLVPLEEVELTDPPAPTIPVDDPAVLDPLVPPRERELVEREVEAPYPEVPELMVEPD